MRDAELIDSLLRMRMHSDVFRLIDHHMKRKVLFALWSMSVVALEFNGDVTMGERTARCKEWGNGCSLYAQ